MPWQTTVNNMVQPDESGVSLLVQSDTPPSSKAATATVSHNGPPVESKDSLRLRRVAILSFWAIAVFLGLPVWLKTTAIYRAQLPLQEMTEWAEGKLCQPVFPLRVAVEAPFDASNAQNLLHTTQIILDKLSEFPPHHLRLFLADAPSNNSTSQQVIRDGTSISSDDKDVALVVRLLQVEPGATPRAQLQPYSPTLDVYFPVEQTPSQHTADPGLAGFLAQELHGLFVEEQAQLAHVLLTASGAQASDRILTPEIFTDLQRQSTRVLKYAPTYHLTFSLFTPSHIPSAWDVQSALHTYLTPLLESFSAISNFTVDTQVQLYATVSPSVRDPEYSEDLRAWTLRKEDLSGFVNAAEWPLSPSIGAGPTVNFILYVPDPRQSPLIVGGSGANSWLIPQWGGVHILNIPSESSSKSFLTTEMLAPAMHTFSDQLISLLGLPRSPASLPLRIATLERVRSASLIFSASSTLGALAQVYQKLPSIPVPDNVAQSVRQATLCLQEACESLREGRLQSALEHARTAQIEAERAFFERSMVGQVYFPDEHKVAVYLPLLGPVAVPLIMAALKELRSVLKRS
ncbi:GPI transamidase component [Coniothyrium glycines]